MTYPMSLLGDMLRDSGGTDVPTSSSLEGKVVGLYFSASWCGPCRGFTPQLIKTYDAVRSAGKEFEVVLIGSDKKRDDFVRYHQKMPWLAVPFEDREKKISLNAKFKVRGIPTLVLLDESGEVITTDGRESIDADPEGKNFPWRPKSLTDLLGTEFQTKSGMKGIETIQGKTLALYFSSHWCPPCRAFTPRLSETYKAMKERPAGNDVEFVFVSWDKDESQFNEYFEDMPWTAIPFKDEERKKALGQRLAVRSIPTLITISPEGVVINQMARGAAMTDAKGLEFPWRPKPVEDLAMSSQSNGHHLQEIPSLIVFMEAADDVDQKEVEEMMMPIAEAEAKAGKKSGHPEVIFFTVKSEGNIPSQVRHVCDLKRTSDAPQMVIVNIPGNGSFHLPPGGASTPVTSSSIKEFVDAFKAGKLERLQLKRG